MQIVKLMGGLGNQMFQYAFAIALQNKVGEPVLLDLSWFEEVKNNAEATQREFELGIFNINNNFASSEQVKICIDKKKSIIPRFICKLIKKPKTTDNTIFQQNPYGFESNLLEKRENAYYVGYFQNEKYFSNMRDQLLKDFSLRSDIDDNNKKLLAQIKSSNSVSLHIRRGDYANNPAINSVHGTCSLDYYKDAIDYISSRVQDAHFYLFSDDINWISENLKLNHPFTIVNINKNGYLDMELMKNCKHNIIANSSFSWWAAWLNQNPNKIVVAPNQWTNKIELSSNDLLLSNWIKI